QRRKEYFQQFLLEGEVIESLYPVGADSLAMTEWRLLFVEEFNTDKSRVLITLPYSQIVEVKMVLGEMYSFSNKVYVATRSETHEFASKVHQRGRGQGVLPQIDAENPANGKYELTDYRKRLIER